MRWKRRKGGFRKKRGDLYTRREMRNDEITEKKWMITDKTKGEE